MPGAVFSCSVSGRKQTRRRGGRVLAAFPSRTNTLDSMSKPDFRLEVYAIYEEQCAVVTKRSVQAGLGIQQGAEERLSNHAVI